MEFAFDQTSVLLADDIVTVRLRVVEHDSDLADPAYVTLMSTTGQQISVARAEIVTVQDFAFPHGSRVYIDSLNQRGSVQWESPPAMAERMVLVHLDSGELRPVRREDVRPIRDADVYALAQAPVAKLPPPPAPKAIDEPVARRMIRPVRDERLSDVLSKLPSLASGSDG